MIPIKIQCGCGQRYAFEVDAPGGTMPYAVACPTCGTDGAAAANLAITQSIAVQPVVIPPTPSSVHLASPAAAVATPAAIRRNAANVPQVDKVQVGHEARAKMFWGDPQEEVIKFLMIGGYNAVEATAMTQTFFLERAAVIRKKGLGKIIIGTPLVCVPIVAFFIFIQMPIFPGRIFGLLLLLGLWGLYLLIKGLIMFFSPKSEPGDIADK